MFARRCVRYDVSRTSSLLQGCGGALSSTRREVLLRGATGDQAGDVVQLLSVLIGEAEGDLQPVAVGLGLEGGDGVQVAIEPRHFVGLALLQIEQSLFQNLWQDFAAAYYQRRFLEGQRLDHAALITTGQAQLALATTGRFF